MKYFIFWSSVIGFGMLLWTMDKNTSPILMAVAFAVGMVSNSILTYWKEQENKLLVEESK